MSKISMVESATATDCKTVDASKFVEAVTNGKWRDKIEPIRRTYQITMEQTGGDSQQAGAAIGELKRKLPAVMWAGVFGQRKAEAIEAHSGLVVVDLDHVGAGLAKAKDTLAKDPCVFACFVSPSGDGLKAVYRVPPPAEQIGRAHV